MIFSSGRVQIVENALASIDSSGLEQVALLAIIEKMEMLEGHVIQLKISIVSMESLHDSADQIPHATALGKPFG
jgi:hypothetical protein